MSGGGASEKEGLFEGDPRLLPLVIATGLALFAVQLDFFSVQTALPSMAADLDTSVTSLQWVLSGYMLALASFFVVGGRLGDILGRRRALLVGMAIFGGSSLVGGAAQSAELVIVMRLVQGVGAAVLFPACVAVVASAFPAAKVQRAVGVAFAVGAIGQGFGPVAGGLLTDLLSWRWVLWVNVPIAIVVIVIALRVVSESRDESVPRTIDWLGLVLIVASIGSFTYGIDLAADDGWTAASTLSLIAIGLALGLLLIAVEARRRYPLLDLRLFRIRLFSVLTGAAGIANLGFGVFVLLAMILLQDLEGLTPIEAGLAFLPFSAGIAIAAVLSGRLEDRRPWAVASLALALGALGLIGAGATSGFVGFALFSAPAGLGMGLSFSYTQVITQTLVPSGQAGAASGVVLTVAVGLGGVGVALASSLLDTGAEAEGVYTRSDLDPIFLACGIALALAAPVVVLLTRGRGAEREAGEPPP